MKQKITKATTQETIKFKPRKFEIEISSTTCRTYFINAETPEAASEIALREMDADWEIHQAWKENAEVSYIEEIENQNEY